MKKHWRPVAALSLALALPATMVPAQTARPQTSPTPPAAATAEQPDRTSAGFGDWTLRCELLRPQGGPVTRSCEVVQTFSDQRGQPMAQLVVGRLVRGEPLRMILQVPLEIRTDQAARILADPAGPAGDAVVLPFRFCSAQRGGCFAELELRDEVALRRLRARGENPGRVEFRDSAGRDVQLPLSARGLGQALDALGRES